MDLGLAYPIWGTEPYPRLQQDRYAQLVQACSIDEIAALKATSWGLGQIMGFNYLLVKCETVYDFVEQNKASEGAQLMLMCRFIKSLLIDKHLRDRNWTSFAKAYNGKEFAKNRYDEKLAAAYRKFGSAGGAVNA